MSSSSLTLAFLLLLCSSLQLVRCQEDTSSWNGNNETQPTCPAYRFLDTSNPNTPIYGAPDGCRCFLGLSGLNCGHCDDDEPCQLQQRNSFCRKDFEPDVTAQEYLAYKCRLFNRLGSLFTNGKASFYLDLKNHSVSLSLFDTRTVNDNRTVDCTFTDCEWEGKNTTCQNAQCNCTDQCNPWVQQLVDNTLKGPTQIIAEPVPPDGREDHHVTVWMEGAPFIEASCTARACAIVEGQQDTMDSETGGTNPDMGPGVDLSDFFGDKEKETQVPKDDDNAGSGSSKLSLIVICIFLGIFVVVVILALVPFLFGTQSCQKKKDYAPPITQVEEEEEESSNSNNKHVLEFRHLTRTIQLKGAAAKAHGQKEKVILKDVSGSVESGTMLGIMGQSGAGKSSLLNLMAAVETTSSARVSGHILLNGKEPLKGYRRAVAYVHQDDALYGTLTVQECIEYSALLRLPRTMTTKEKQALVWKTLKELQLVDIAHNRIGTTGHASVSGGERKRVSIGMELVAMPTVLALDEPTSGLDSSAANKIMNVLSNLASRNRIVILSIHQPSMKSFLLMDQILLLGGGSVAYNGKPREVKGYLEERGFPCPEDETIADYMLDVVSDEANLKLLRASETSSRDCTENDNNAQTKAADDVPDSNQFEELSNESGSIANEVTTLFARTARDTFRNLELFLMQVAISILLACFAGAVFAGVTPDLAGFQNRMGAFYFSLSFFGFASFSSMDIFVKERHIFERETGAKMYRPFSYFVSKTVLDVFVLRVIPVTIFSFCFYWLMGLSKDFEKFIVFWATMVLFNVCAGIISICISIAAPTVGQANLIAVVWFLIMLLFGGFLINVETMASWYAWLKYISIFYYAFELLITNELSGLLLQFDAPGFPTVPVYGEVFVETLGMDAGNQTRDLLCLCALAAGYSLLAYLFLWLRVPPSASTYFNRMQIENRRLYPNGKAIQPSSDEDGEAIQASSGEEGASTPRSASNSEMQV